MNQSSDLFFWGKGGQTPGLEIYDASVGKTIDIINLPSGNSCYAMDIEPENGAIAMGTKGGLIFICDKDRKSPLDKTQPYSKLIQGAPVLSVSWVERSILAAGDNAGRILLWETQKENPSPKILHQTDTAVCALESANSGYLASMTSDGVFQLWDVVAGFSTYSKCVCSPPSIGGLVQMVYWSNAYVFVCPGTGGELNLLSPEADIAKTLFAHSHDYYALSPYGDKLITVGMLDGQLKIWSANSEQPEVTMRTPKNIIAACVKEGTPPKIILIESNGKAGLYVIEDGNLKRDAYLEGRNYRTVTCHPSLNNDCIFRMISATDSDSSRPPIPDDSGQ